ncbi:MAG: hypothetical protein CMN21_16335 [Rubinisphaera sp.]|nr:hypothetical protein [Rubinisphaera sp.]
MRTEPSTGVRKLGILNDRDRANAGYYPDVPQKRSEHERSEHADGSANASHAGWYALIEWMAVY